MKKAIILAAVIAVLAGSAYYLKVYRKGADAPQITEQPTNFARAGVVVFNNPGLKQDVPYLIYEEPGAPALTKELVMDELSACAYGDGSEQCIALNAPREAIFGGQKAAVEGIELPDGTVLVRKLRKLREGELAVLPGAGRVFVSWESARKMLEDCRVRMVMQTHSLDVILSLEGGTEVVTVEPKIDDVFAVTNNIRARCGQMPIATE